MINLLNIYITLNALNYPHRIRYAYSGITKIRHTFIYDKVSHRNTYIVNGPLFSRIVGHAIVVFIQYIMV
jgi:hypothetical protein